MQARRLRPHPARRVAPGRSPRRYLGPLVVAGLVLGVLARLLVGGTAPPAVDPDEPVLGGGPVAALEAALEGVPVENAAVAEAAAPAGEAPDPRAAAHHRLREAVFAPFRGIGGRFGIAVKDLGSDQSVFWNETFPFQAASLYKLPVMYEVFKLRDWGLLTFREELTIGAGDAAMDLGSLSWPVGTRITLGTAVERMVTISDNSSAIMLARKVGTWRINEDLATLGLKQTYIRGDDLSTSARDMLGLLELIAHGQAIDAPASAEMVHLLARQQIRNRIPANLPPEATVANKTGNWEGAAHDVAIVYAPRATLVLAFLSDGVTDLDAVYDAMASAARNVYDLASDPAFDTRPSPTLPPAASGSYAVAAKLPIPTAIPTAVPTRPAPQIAPTASIAPIAPPTRAPVLVPVQPAAPAAPAATSAPTQAPAAPTAAAPTPASRQEARPTRTPKPDNGPAPTATPAIKPSVPSIFNPGNSNPFATPAAKPQ